jgi:DNA repair exonuclease SbcCD ATPase subunit
MKSYRENLQSAFVVASQTCRSSSLALLALLLLLFWPTASAMAQSASAPPAQTPAPAQAAPQPAASQTDTENKPQSLAEASRAAKAQKDATKSKRVYTGDDLAHIHGTISEVGSGSSGDGSPQGYYSGGDSGENETQSANANKEAYWRGQAHAIMDQIAAVDQRIEQKKAEISKAGGASMDPMTGLTQNVIIIHDRNAELKQLEDRKQNLQRQLDNLADQGRKAGADPGWFR